MRVGSLGVFVVVLVTCGCAGSSKLATPPQGPDWLKRPDTCFLSGRVVLDGELRASTQEDVLARIECRHLRVRLDTDDGSSHRVEADGNFAAGYGECHYQFGDVPPGQSTLGAEWELAPEIKGRYLFRADAAFNAVVCSPDSRTWNQTVDLVMTLPDVLGRPENVR